MSKTLFLIFGIITCVTSCGHYQMLQSHDEVHFPCTSNLTCEIIHEIRQNSSDERFIFDAHDPKLITSFEATENHTPVWNSYICLYMRNMQNISLERNKIRNITRHAFVNCKVLKVLNLSHNNLTQLELGLFDRLRSLIHLNLSHNKFKLFDPNIVEGLVSLTSLDLSSNQLLDLDARRMMGFLPSLRFVRIKNNKIRCIRIPVIAKDFEEKKIYTDGSGYRCNTL